MLTAGVYPASQFSKPNFHEVLTDVRIALKIDSGNELTNTNYQNE
ncbi:MAG: hypothetical protein ACK4QL_05850 [Pseudanabaenaceae cyanobacterium]